MLCLSHYAACVVKTDYTLRRSRMALLTSFLSFLYSNATWFYYLSTNGFRHCVGVWWGPSILRNIWYALVTIFFACTWFPCLWTPQQDFGMSRPRSGCSCLSYGGVPGRKGAFMRSSCRDYFFIFSLVKFDLILLLSYKWPSFLPDRKIPNVAGSYQDLLSNKLHWSHVNIQNVHFQKA